MNIVIDPEFKALIPPLKPEEFAQLEANILADGCREPIVVWQVGDAEYVIVDGHNRYEICTRHGIPFDRDEYDFESRESAMDWMDANQLGRRNLTANDFTLILGRRYNRQKKSQGGDRGNQYVAKDQIDTLPTADRLAAEYGVSPATVKRAGAVAESLEDASPELMAAVHSNALSINLAAQVADLPEEAQAIVSAAAPEEIKEVAREIVKAHVANNSGNNEWYTPPKYIELARTVMGGIDTDPASSEVANKTVGAGTFYTSETNGLMNPWAGNVWMNPPYAQPLITEFSDAIASKYQSGEIKQACVLVNNATETQWFQRMLSAADAVCFPKSRIKFIDPQGNPSGAPLQGQAIIYFGKEVSAFASAFASEGSVMVHG